MLCFQGYSCLYTWQIPLSLGEASLLWGRVLNFSGKLQIQSQVLWERSSMRQVVQSFGEAVASISLLCITFTLGFLTYMWSLSFIFFCHHVTVLKVILKAAFHFSYILIRCSLQVQVLCSCVVLSM